MLGRIYLVATPIGNLEDMTYRGVRILSEVACIGCEDTRQTQKLLKQYGLRNRVVSYHEHNESSRTPELIQRLLSGEDVALVSDAGTPLVSDPGSVLVRRAIEEGIDVIPIPGPSAVLAALSSSGLPTDQFHFAGFLPPRSARRRKVLTELCEVTATLILYEAPHRILASLRDIADVLGDRPMAAARELTKIHEEILRGTPSSIGDALAARPSVKGEFTLVIGHAPEAPVKDVSDDELAERIDGITATGVSRMDAIKSVARELGLPKRDVYRRLQE